MTERKRNHNAGSLNRYKEVGCGTKSGSNAWCHHGLEFHATNALLRSHTLWWAWGCFGKGQSLCPEASQRGSDLSDLSSIYWKRPQTSCSPLWYQNNPMVLGLKPTCAAKGREKNEDRLAREQALDGHWPRTETTVVKDATSVEPQHVSAIVVSIFSIVGYAAPSTYKSMYIIVYYRITMYIYIYSQSFSYIYIYMYSSPWDPTVGTENSRRRFQAAFSPVSDPSKYLAPALYGSKVWLGWDIEIIWNYYIWYIYIWYIYIWSMIYHISHIYDIYISYIIYHISYIIYHIYISYITYIWCIYIWYIYRCMFSICYRI